MSVGHGKRGMIELRRDGHEPIVVTQRETMMDQAIHGAVDSLKRAVESAYGKRPLRIVTADSQHLSGAMWSARRLDGRRPPSRR